MTLKKMQFLQKKYIDIIFYILLFSFCINKSTTLGFWYDELSWTLNYLHQKSIFEMLYLLSEKIYNLPGYYIILHPFYQISHNPIWLRLPSIIASLLAIFYIQKLTVKYYGDYCKFIIWALLLYTKTFYFIALQVRPYAFILLFSAYSFYIFCQKQNKNSLSITIKYSLSITLLAYTHWFGCLLVACYGLIDAYLFLTKRNNIKFIIPYLICFFAFTPWLILLYKNHIINPYLYWGHKPNYKDIIALLYYICGGKITFIIFILSFTMILHKNNSTTHHILPEHSAIFIIFFILLIVFTYSTINPSGSLIVPRYFLIIIPQYIFLSASFLITIIHKFQTKKRPKFLFILLSGCITLYIYTLGDIANIYKTPIFNKFTKYKELLELYHNDVKTNKTLLWFNDEKFLDIYNISENIDIIFYVPHNLYNARFSKNYRIDPIDFDKYFENIKKIQHMSCENGINHLFNLKKLSLFKHLKKEKKYTSLQNNYICNYDVIYISYKILQSPLIKYFLERHFDIQEIQINPNEVPIYKLTQKKQLS